MNAYMFNPDIPSGELSSSLPNPILVSSFEPSDPPPIISFSELANAVDVIRSREDEDRAKITQIETLSSDIIRERVTKWAMAQFPENYPLHTAQFNTLSTCSDGVARGDIFDYMQFLNPTFSLVRTLHAIEQRLPGMKLTYSYTHTLMLYIHVSKKE
jgi:hypothetical protein